ncbi:MAG TPA: pyridoxamine 5'-phosphate oxidase [Vulgatibacter sp.]|nr:pyridoxamine 5'-phosphate oxidase [Vulgatibacter sp.]
MTSQPIDQFKTLLARAQSAGEPLAEAMALATADEAGNPSVRMVLLKGADERGFVFFTNLESRKAQELRARPRAALCFHWALIEEQVRVEGPVEPLPPEEADAYFRTRPRGSQLGAWASKQSRPLASREELVARVAEEERRFEGKEVERPPFWSGYVVRPERIEFWSGQPDRLHDRFVYTRAQGEWIRQRLYP